MATNTEKLQEILSGAQAVAPRIRTETPVQQIEQSVIDVKGGVDPLEVPDIGLPTKKKKQPLSQPSTGLSYSAVDEPLQSVDYGDPASFSNVENLLTQGTSFAESPQRFTRTGTVSSAEGGDFFDDIADLDEFGAVGPDGKIDPDIIGDPFDYGSIEGFAKDVYNRPISETFNQAIRDFGNFLEFGDTRPTIETVNSPFGLAATQVTDRKGNLTTPGFFSGTLTALGAPVGLAGRYGTRALDYLTTDFAADFYDPGNVPMSYDQHVRSEFMGLQMAADPNIGTGWSTPIGGVSYASWDPNRANIDPITQMVIDETGVNPKFDGAVVTLDGNYTYTINFESIPDYDASKGITAEQVQDYLDRTPTMGYSENLSVAQQIADALNRRATGAGLDTFDDPNAPTGPETGLDLAEIESRMEDISKFGPPVDDEAFQPYDMLSRDRDALNYDYMSGSPEGPDTSQTGPSDADADRATMYDIDEIESAENYDPDEDPNMDDPDDT